LSTLKGGRDLPVFSQIQSASRYGLLKSMANSKNGILMGTSSFWEGIDLSGDMLEILIIAKLPFQVPSDPIVKAYSDKLSDHDMNPFLNFTVPECILKYRQGFGRLIRTSLDQGIFIVLDNRIVTKRYGQHFQDAIPVEMQMFSTLDSLIL
jgi:Rad3-related DNA helicase